MSYMPDLITSEELNSVTLYTHIILFLCLGMDTLVSSAQKKRCFLIILLWVHYKNGSLNPYSQR